MATWQCISGCGACCYLEPSDRPDLWCINFDRLNRQCGIYAERPRFCRVQPDTFFDMFGIEAEELDEFAIACCEEQIESIYGDRSLELLRFENAISNVQIV